MTQSTTPLSFLYRAPKPRRKHSRDGSIRCDLCAPLRCERAARRGGR